MSEARLGMLVLIGLSVVSSLVCHALIRSYLWAAFVAAIAAGTLFFMLATLRSGYVDPFLPIAFVFAELWAFGIALVVGVPFAYARKRSGRPSE